ncbi:MULTISPECIES: dienelactone hydrolase family protein [Amycolatopsis]|uniref:Dienelactone hydrolase n=2 Tax=Amycolatopsis TaxID=1813 RepID=A0A1I3JWB0_9PSEU|nr:alpha/beta family hydrolase [Amycolatopsis sacchari]SFI64328.1 Dienelactone hydrolase [Amycolatopsis sacchari]
MFFDDDVRLPLGDLELEAHLALPSRESGVVVFAHGSGSSRHSPRNRRVAEVLRQARLGTLLVDLLTAEEERADELRFDIPVLAGRVAAIVDWLADQPATAHSAVGLFGASTGAGAALLAAAERPAAVRAVVSRGGRPDLAGDALTRVQAPTLLIVGERDETVLDLNRQALDRLRSGKHLEVVPGAGHLFEEPGTLDQAARLAADWFTRNVGTGPAVPPSA